MPVDPMQALAAWATENLERDMSMLKIVIGALVVNEREHQFGPWLPGQYDEVTITKDDMLRVARHFEVSYSTADTGHAFRVTYKPDKIVSPSA